MEEHASETKCLLEALAKDKASEFAVTGDIPDKVQSPVKHFKLKSEPPNLFDDHPAINEDVCDDDAFDTGHW